MTKVLFQKRLFLNNENVLSSDYASARIETDDNGTAAINAEVQAGFYKAIFTHKDKDDALQYLNNLQNFVDDLKHTVLGITPVDDPNDPQQ